MKYVGREDKLKMELNIYLSALYYLHLSCYTVGPQYQYHVMEPLITEYYAVSVAQPLPLLPITVTGHNTNSQHTPQPSPANYQIKVVFHRIL